jgi:hypothetical protein
MIAVGLLLLVGASWTLGRLALRLQPLGWLRWWERAALFGTAGLGLTALGISLLTLAGGFAYSTWFLVALTTPAALDARAEFRQSTRPQRPRGDRESPDPLVIVSMAAIALACFGAIAPVTEGDALSYVVPEAVRIAETGRLDVWPDLARMMWPLSQQVVLAYLVSVAGHSHLGLLTALQLLLCAGTLSALARKACNGNVHVGAVLAIALGSPAVAFLAASGKEDLFVVAATAGCAFFVAGTPTRRDLAAAGLFAGAAAGAKYPGLGVAIGVVLWTALSSREARVERAATVAAAAFVAGGLWYGLNLVRFGNPVAPFVFGVPNTPMDAGYVHALLDGYGTGSERSLWSFLTVPFEMFVDPERFVGRGNMLNPLPYAAVLAWRSWRRHGASWFIAGVLYVGWFFTLQNPRLLLPALVLLAPAAAEALVPMARTRWATRVAAVIVVTVCAGVVAAVGVVRVYRYAANPSTFLESETHRYADIEWMNANLDASRHRVGSFAYQLAYLSIPWIYLDASHQLEISNDELMSDRWVAACIRQRITHVFGVRADVAGFESQLREVYSNPASRLGGARFFRAPPTEETVLYEIRHDRGVRSGRDRR